MNNESSGIEDYEEMTVYRCYLLYLVIFSFTVWTIHSLLLASRILVTRWGDDILLNLCCHVIGCWAFLTVSSPPKHLLHWLYAIADDLSLYIQYSNDSLNVHLTHSLDLSLVEGRAVLGTDWMGDVSTVITREILGLRQSIDGCRLARLN